MEALGVQAALLARGTKLLPPASQAELIELSNVDEAKADKYILDIYSKFNGFEACDQKSQFSIWSVDRVIEGKSPRSEFDGNIYVAVGDFLVDSDFIMWCLHDVNMPVYLLYERRELAVSVADFFEKLVAGIFDFIG